MGVLDDCGPIEVCDDVDFVCAPDLVTCPVEFGDQVCVAGGFMADCGIFGCGDPPPSITEYRPVSTLVVPEHEVPRAKFPVVDLHGHPPTLDDPETIAEVVRAMDDRNLQVIVQARAFGFRIGEISCPARYFDGASSISFRPAVRYGLGVIATSVQYRLHAMRLLRPRFLQGEPAATAQEPLDGKRRHVG